MVTRVAPGATRRRNGRPGPSTGASGGRNPVGWAIRGPDGPPRPSTTLHPGRPGPSTGQALAEFALVAPVLIAFILAIAEVGILGQTALAWRQLAGALAGASAGALPPWAAAELARAGCDGPAEYLPGDPPRVVIRCEYRLRLVSGVGFPASFEAIAPEVTP